MKQRSSATRTIFPGDFAVFGNILPVRSSQ
jgi:hypothetical protein